MPSYILVPTFLAVFFIRLAIEEVVLQGASSPFFNRATVAARLISAEALRDLRLFILCESARKDHG